MTRRISIVFAGGFCGALARYYLSAPFSLVTSSLPGARAGLPFDILAINLSGAFALGLLYGLIERRVCMAPEIRLFVGTGFLGAYTTFSSLAYGGVRLAASGEAALAVAYLVGSVALGIAAARLGSSSAALLFAQRRLLHHGFRRVRRVTGRAQPAFRRARSAPPPAHRHNDLRSLYARGTWARRPTRRSRHRTRAGAPESGGVD